MAITAKQYEAPDGAEVIGIILMAYIDHLEQHVTTPILARYDIDAEHVEAEKWYPNQMFLDIERAIFESPGGPNALVAIGKSAAENYIAPEGVTSLEGAIQSLPGVYTTNQRNLPDGYGWLVEHKGDQHYVFTNNTGTSNHAAYGYVWALCQKMKAPGTTVHVVPQGSFDPDATEPIVIDLKWS